MFKQFGSVLPFSLLLIFYCLAPGGQFPCWISKEIKIKEIKSENNGFLGVVLCWHYSMQLMCPKMAFD